MAQSGSAQRLGRWGRGFESLRPDQSAEDIAVLRYPFCFTPYFGDRGIELARKSAQRKGRQRETKGAPAFTFGECYNHRQRHETQAFHGVKKSKSS